jgi:hypothetical protein
VYACVKSRISVCYGHRDRSDRSSIDQTGTSEAQTGLTDPPTDLTGLVVPDNPVLEDSASNGLE